MLAYVVLAGWPLCCLLLFMRLPAANALLWSVVGGYLLIPAGAKLRLSGLPDLDKTSVISIGIVLGVLFFTKRNANARAVTLERVLILLLLFAPVGTALLNGDPIVTRVLYLRGLQSYDGISMVADRALMVAPYWAAARILTTETSHRALLTVLASAVLAYTLPILFEIRISPQLQSWIYGFAPYSFAQQERGGGYRAAVFLGHGLVVATVLGLAVLAAVTLGRTRQRILGFPATLSAFYLVVVLLLQKSLGAVVLGVVLGFSALFSTPRRQLTVAAMMVALVVTYPLVRGAHLLPLAQIQSTVADFSGDRAQSFGFRLENEERLLAKAEERPLFGWGGWGRNRIYSEYSGRDVSVTDGAWILQIGIYGWIGYIATFGLLALPVFRLRRMAIRGLVVPASSSGLALLLAYNLLDLLPNDSLSPLTWMIAGALSGFVSESLARARRPVVPTPAASSPAASASVEQGA